jgi:type I restriction enzyme M protein
MSRRGESTEADAYKFIDDNLKLQDWDIRNPSRHPNGQVYTQNEYRSHDELSKLLGLKTPEAIVKITESCFWVIESKKDHEDLGKALSEAKDYAERINKSTIIKAKFVSGVAGNESDGFFTKSAYFDGSAFKQITINGKEITGLLSFEESSAILRTNNPNIDDAPINIKLFISKAEKINETLHEGAVLPNQRAKVMAALLLSMLGDTSPNVDAEPSVLISDINARAERVLRSQGKPEFSDYIKITLPSTEENHTKFKKALVSTLQELHILNIRSAMNSGHDVLGQFYEVFLKYANWAKELGIVLTPRHITRYAADVMNIGLHDIVLDITCGTGGFLVAALDYIKKNYTGQQVDDFKKYSLFGLEQEPSVASLAIVNMIFRGDGKNNILERDCFVKYLAPATISGNRTAKFVDIQASNPPINKVLMNPPFALKKGSEKEFKFVSHALNQMEDGGYLFSILPYSVMVKTGKYLSWRKELLKHNTLLSVITFPQDLFYPIGVHTVGIFVKKGVSHPLEQNVLWIRAMNDGFAKSKGKRLPNNRITNDLEKISILQKTFLFNPSQSIENIPRFQKAAPINFDDNILELVPEAYLDDIPPSIEEINRGVDQVIRETVAFLVTNRMEL